MPRKKSTPTVPDKSESTGYFGPVPDNPELNPVQPLTAAEVDDSASAFQKRIGITVDLLKEKFDKSELEFDDKTKSLVNRIRDVINGGIEFSLQDWRVYAAIDEAYNVSYKQINPTLVRKVLEKRLLKWDEIATEFESWGLNTDEFWMTVKDERGNDIKILKDATFWKIFIPLVKSYLTIRLAKLYNDRDQYPLFKYEPIRFTDEAWMVGEILTELVERMVVDYGYRSVFRQQLHQMLKYSFSFMFPSEAWHKECTADVGGDGQYAVRQGLRYNIPHPTKVAWDLNYRPSTFNTDTGCEWAFYWRVYKYKDIYGSPFFWRKEMISAGTRNWITSYPQYFSEVFPCRMTAVNPSESRTSSRDDSQAYFYQKSDSEKAVFLSDLFMKITPSEYGLGDYAHPVWFRFVIANDDCVVFAEPLAYCPVLYVGYDEDQNQPRNPGMALEIMPWQDATGNLLSQWVLSLHQNLKQIVAYDKKAVTEKAISELTATSKNVEKTTWMGVDLRQLANQGGDMSKMFFPITFPKNDIGQFVITMDKMFTIMERTLNMSAAETGAAGVHIQTAEEIRVISNNVSNRVGYTGASVDDFVDGWKRQLAAAQRAYADKEFVVEVSKTSSESVKVLTEKLGFELVDDYGKGVKVKGERNKVALGAYISSREFQNRTNDPQIANVILQNLATISKTPLGAALSPEQLAEIFNRVNKLMGGPRDWRIRAEQPPQQPGQPGPDGGQGGNQMESLMQQIAQFVQQQIGEAGQVITQNIMQQVTEGMQPVVQAVQETREVNDQQQAAIQNLGQLVLKLDGILKAADQAPPPPQIIPPPGMQPQG